MTNKEELIWISKKACEKCIQAKEKFAKQFEKKYDVKYHMADDPDGFSLMVYYGLEFVPIIIFKNKSYSSIMAAAKELLQNEEENK